MVRLQAGSQRRTNRQGNMSGSSQSAATQPLASAPRVAQWGLLLGASFAAALIFEAIGLPAALLLGPMIGGIVVGVNGGAIRIARPFYYGAQAILGCLIARAITPAIVAAFLKHS